MSKYCFVFLSILFLVSSSKLSLPAFATMNTTSFLYEGDDVRVAKAYLNTTLDFVLKRDELFRFLGLL